MPAVAYEILFYKVIWDFTICVASSIYEWLPIFYYAEKYFMRCTVRICPMLHSVVNSVQNMPICHEWICKAKFHMTVQKPVSNINCGSLPWTSYLIFVLKTAWHFPMKYPFPWFLLFHCRSNFRLIEHLKDDFMQIGFHFSASVGKRYDNIFFFFSWHLLSIVNCWTFHEFWKKKKLLDNIQVDRLFNRWLL